MGLTSSHLSTRAVSQEVKSFQTIKFFIMIELGYRCRVFKKYTGAKLNRLPSKEDTKNYYLRRGLARLECISPSLEVRRGRVIGLERYLRA